MAKSSKKKKQESSDASEAALASPVEDSLFYQVYQLNKMFREVADNTLCKFSLSQRSYWLLECIHRDSGYSQSQLGELLGVDRSDMVRLIDSLEEASLLQRVRSTADRRKQLITITEDGEAIRTQIRAALAEAEDNLLEQLNAKQSARLRKYASKLTMGVPL